MTGTRIAQKNKVRHAILNAVLLLLVLASASVGTHVWAQSQQRDQFVAAWTAASKGDHDVFSRLPVELAQYELFPYLVYEQLRHQRASIPAVEIAAFLEKHSDWGFAAGLRQAWLRTLGKQGKWSDFLLYAPASLNTGLRCYKARALINTGQQQGLMKEAQDLWVAGKSQPAECDPVFTWLKANGGITRALAWERVYLAMAGGNSRFTLYLARFLPPQDRLWLERWQAINRSAYAKIGLMVNWPDQEITREIAGISLQRFARHNAQQAWQEFLRLDLHFNWPANTRGGIIREIALRSAVALNADALEILAALPLMHRDDQILQWWARVALASGEWLVLNNVIGLLPPESKADGRWRYWHAIALEKLGQSERADLILESLSTEASYYGFLAADKLNKPYTICPLKPEVTEQSLLALRQQADFSRSLELRAAGLDNWALSEWSLAVAGLDRNGLRTAAALAVEEGWHDRAIFALGNSGDRQFYNWRFPLLWEQEVKLESARNRLDPAWTFGVMRSESALVESAQSPAGALGLMQITPATARSLSRKYGIAFKRNSQLKEAALNIRFGTRFMRELMEKFDQNPVLVSGAYNAGPNAVDRWLDSRPRGDAAVWVETIPYFETRDYIPRVLAFTAIYDWRLQRPVTRVSSRMPDLNSSTMKPIETTTVVCEIMNRTEVP